MKKHVKVVATIVVICIILSFVTLAGFEISIKSREKILKTIWIPKTRTLLKYAYTENSQTAGFGFVFYEYATKCNVKSTYYILSSLKTLGIPVNHNFEKAISEKTIAFLDNECAKKKKKPDRGTLPSLTYPYENGNGENPEYPTLLNKLEMNFDKIENIYYGYSLLDKNGINCLTSDVWDTIRNIYGLADNTMRTGFKENRPSEFNKKELLYSTETVLYSYKIFKINKTILWQEMQDELWLCKEVLPDIRLPDSGISNLDTEINLNLIKLALETGVPLPEHLAKETEKYLQKRTEYLEKSANSTVKSAREISDLNDMAVALGIRLKPEKHFLQRLKTEELGSGGWSENGEIFNPETTYKILRLLKLTGNLSILNKNKQENLVKSVIFFKRKCGFTNPYSIEPDPGTTYYGICVAEFVGFPINKEKVVVFLKEMVGIDEKKITKIAEDFFNQNNGITANMAVSNISGPLTDLYFSLKALHKFGVRSEDKAAKAAIERFFLSKSFIKGISYIPPDIDLFQTAGEAAYLSGTDAAKIGNVFSKLGASLPAQELKKNLPFPCSVNPDYCSTKSVFFLSAFAEYVKNSCEESVDTFCIQFNRNCYESLKESMLNTVKERNSFFLGGYAGYHSLDSFVMPNLESTFYAVKTFESFGKLVPRKKRTQKVRLALYKTGRGIFVSSAWKNRIPHQKRFLRY